MLTWPPADLPAEVVARIIGPGAPFELAEESVLGVPMPVFVNRPRSFAQILREGADRLGDRPFLVFPDREFTFRSILGPVAAVARSLSRDFGVGQGDRVAVVSANRAEYALTFWAATVLGAVTVALNGWWTGPEMAFAIDLTSPKVVLGDKRRLERLEDGYRRKLADSKVPVVTFEDDFSDLERAGGAGNGELPAVDIDEDDPYVILFTSGTTGRPKGAVLSHRGNIHFGLAMQVRGAEAFARMAMAGQAVEAPPAPCSINAAPMFHVAGLTCTMALAPMNAMTIVYPPPGRWSEEVQFELTEKHRATMWSLVPTQLWRLLDHPDIDRYDLSSLRNIGGGSAVWPPELLKRLEQKLPWARPGLGVGYGMTETNGIGTSLSATATYTHPDAIGIASPTVQVEVRDPATRQPLPDGEIGEIALRSAAMFVGYWENPEATAAAVDEDRWYHTGDFGMIRDGYVYLEGRRSDLIIRGGENIYPVEIENRIIEHPAVAEVAVVGVDHPTLGQEVKAYIVLHPTPGGATAADAAAIQAWCAEGMASFKVPSQVEFLAELPHNATGKVVKHLLGRPAGESTFVQE